MTRLFFIYSNPAGTASNVATLLPYTGTDYYAQKAGRVKSVTIVASSARTAGTLTGQVLINATADTVINPAIGANNTQFAEKFGDRDDLTFVAGDRIGLQAVTAGWTPTTNTIIGIVEIDEGE